MFALLWGHKGTIWRHLPQVWEIRRVKEAAPGLNNAGTGHLLHEPLIMQCWLFELDQKGS